MRQIKFLDSNGDTVARLTVDVASDKVDNMTVMDICCVTLSENQFPFKMGDVITRQIVWDYTTEFGVQAVLTSPDTPDELLSEPPAPITFTVTEKYVNEASSSINPDKVTAGVVQGTEFNSTPTTITGYEYVKTVPALPVIVEEDLTITHQYQAVVTPPDKITFKGVVKGGDTSQPLGGMKMSVSEGSTTVEGTTASDGSFSIDITNPTRAAGTPCSYIVYHGDTHYNDKSEHFVVDTTTVTAYDIGDIVLEVSSSSGE